MSFRPCHPHDGVGEETGRLDEMLIKVLKPTKRCSNDGEASGLPTGTLIILVMADCFLYRDFILLAILSINEIPF